MKSEVKNKVNVSPTLIVGHHVKDAKTVINLDEVNEIFSVKGKSELVTKNHTTLIMPESCIIICQEVYNPFTKTFEKSKD